MRRATRNLLRLLALLGLAGVLIGVPIVVAATVGTPMPSIAQWRAVWQTHRVDTELVQRLGAGVFVLLWAWFAVTALAELWRVLPRRHDPSAIQALQRTDAPSDWVRGLVRFIAVSSLAASTAVGSISAAAHPSFVRAAPSSIARSTGVSSVSVDILDTVGGVPHVVVPGDSYWRIADHHLAAVLHRKPAAAEVHALTHELIDLNAPRLGHRNPTLLVPGDVVVLDVLTAAAPSPAPAADALPPAPVQSDPVPATPAHAPVEPTAAEPRFPTPSAAPASSDNSMVVEGLAAALLLSVGALGALEARRRRRLRSAGAGSRLAPSTLQQARTEMMMRSSSAAERLARLDLALRSVARDLAEQRTSVLAAVLGDGGDVRIHLRGAASPKDARSWIDDGNGWWMLPGSVPLEELARDARGAGQPCPALVHLGMSEGGEVFLDLEAAGVLAVASPAAASVLEAIAASLAVSPFMDDGTVVTVGLTDVALGERAIEPVLSLEAALDRMSVMAGGVASLARDATTFALRVDDTSGESWGPTIVVAAGQVPDEAIADRLSGVTGGRGVGVVVDDWGEGAQFVLRYVGPWHVLEPLGLELVPVGARSADLEAVSELLAAADLPLETHAEVVPIAGRSVAPAFVEPDWHLLVRLFGAVEVVSDEGVSVRFDRSKALELVVWLSLHRERPTRSKARTALWDTMVRDATFANVVSDARRSMARVVPPPQGEEWVARTLTEDLPLHGLVVSDADLLATRVAAARGLPSIDAIEVLRPGLELVTGLPFEGTGYLWTDAEGHTSALVLLATGAAIELANHYLSSGDIDGVFWATGQGLKVLNGHEELIALRMRAHAMRGDRAGVRHEWESYERALASDPWAAAEPAPKLVALRRQLLGGESLAGLGSEAAGARVG